MADTSLGKFTKHYHKSDVIFEENSLGDEMYIVHSGRVRLFTQRERDDPTTLAIVEEGGFFGEMSLVDHSPRSATAVAEENTCLIALDRPKFVYMIQQQPRFVFTVMHALCDRIRAANLMIAKIKDEVRQG